MRISDNASLPDEFRGGVVAIGNFDGVHRGHQAVLNEALAIAKRDNLPALVLTFEPHPKALFQSDNPPFRISPAPLKAKLLEALGFDVVIEQAFNKAFAGKSANEFVDEILLSELGVSHVVTGFDFHFGKARQGGPAFMMEAGEKNDFGVRLVDAFRDEAAEVISSSRIRKLLLEGDVSQAAGLLGYHYTISEEISKGQQLGRTLGYPTANMVLPEDFGLKTGIYAVRFRDGKGKLFNGVASFGKRPTVEDDGKPILETYVFDFDGDLYGQLCDVHLFAYLRGEEKFDGLDALVTQMKLDEEEARNVLSGVKPIGQLDQNICFDD